jgi:DNA-binding MarR family transcriptional regulator
MSSPILDNLPTALSEHVGYLLVRLGKHAQRLFSLKVEPLGVRPAHCDILFTLVARGSLAQVEIANILSIERAHLVSLLDQLEGMGLVLREPDAVDRRRHAVRLTAKGVQVSTKISRLASQVEDELVTPLTHKERDLLRKMLRVLAKDADEGDL